MTQEAYLTRFRLLQHAIEKDERSLKMIQSPQYQKFLHHFSSSPIPVLQSQMLGKESLETRLSRRRRLCERYAARIARAVEKIESRELKEYARYHYLYGLTNEQISEISLFSVRTVYRHAKLARKALFDALLSVSPRPVRCKKGRFAVRGRLPRRTFSPDALSRSLASLTARRNSAPYRPRILWA